jgi:hypothetical protein
LSSHGKQLQAGIGRRGARFWHPGRFARRMWSGRQRPIIPFPFRRRIPISGYSYGLLPFSFNQAAFD